MALKPDLAPPRQQIVILQNPKAGRAKTNKISAVTKLLQSQGCAVRLLVMSDLAGLPAQIDEIIKSAPDVIVAAGGDGTINKILSHLGDTTIPLAILPVGTANVLAESLNIPKQPAALARYILTGTPREARAGNANGECFCCMASVGFDADVVNGVNLKLKSLFSKGAYVFEALRVLFRHKDQEFAVIADGNAHLAYGAIVTLTRFYGGRHLIAPKASPFAQDFTLILFRGKGRRNLLRYALALALGRIDKLRDIEILSAREVEILSASENTVQIDGDILGRLPVKITRNSGVFLLNP